MTLFVLDVQAFLRTALRRRTLKVLVDEKLDETLESLPLFRGTPKF